MTTPTIETGAAYRDASRSIEVRIDDLLGRMTPAEKRAQLGSAWVFQLADGEALDEEAARELLADGLGQVTRVSGASALGAVQAAAVADAIQRHLVEETRLGIPAIVHEENCSGLMAREATIFPQAIGVASTWRPELAEAMADVVRTQMRSAGAHQGLAPVLDVCRDPRWGRTEETYGEDPELVSRMGVAFVRGLQGELGPSGVLATGKHLVGYAASEGGMNWAPAHIPPRELREVHLRPFERAVKEAGLRSIMNGYHELDGVPCGASRELLTDILRGEWGFDGIVVSDYFSVNQLWEYHRIATGKVEAAAMALHAGIDVELPSTDCYGEVLAEAVASGRVSDAAIDLAVRRVLRAKFELGLFEQPHVDRSVAVAMDAPEQRSLARDIARQSLVLLRNEGDLLPLGRDVRRIAVIGPNAASERNLIGDYSYPSHVESLLEMRDDNTFGVPVPEGFDLGEDPAVPIVSVLQGIRDAFPDAEVTHAAGCDLTDPSTDGFAEAVGAAAAADVAVLVVGDRAGLTWEATSGEGRDRASLDLPGVQEQLAAAVAATGTPVVAVLVVGRPVGSPSFHGSCDAVLLAWLPGEEGGTAIAEVLTGDVAPGGKLPISYPRTVGQIPVFHGHKRSGGRSHWKGDYVDASSRPLYPFGYGLSTTSFAITDVTLDRTTVDVGGTVEVRLRVTNTGPRAGDEVVQVYTRDPEASVTRPVRELRDFARVHLAAGETTDLTFALRTDDLGFHGRDHAYVVEPGRIDVLVGRSCDDIDAELSFTITDTDTDRRSAS